MLDKSSEIRRGMTMHKKYLKRTTSKCALSGRDIRCCRRATAVPVQYRTHSSSVRLDFPFARLDVYVYPCLVLVQLLGDFQLFAVFAGRNAPIL